MTMARALCISLLLAGSALAQSPVVADGGIVNGITYAAGQPVAPGSIASIFGTDLAASLAQADSVPLSSSLASVSVTVNGIPAPLFFVSPGQINIQVPWNVLPDGVEGGLATVVVNRGQAQSTERSVRIASVSPAIFTVGTDGEGNAIAINPDGTIAAPIGSITGLLTHPAEVGQPIVILASGLGAVSPMLPNGANSADQLRSTVQIPDVLIGGQPAQVLFSGLSPSFTAVNQINAVVPSITPNSAVALQLHIADLTTSDKVTIAVQ
jgi:uncharacterized protein (TIGR03437 family)